MAKSAESGKQNGERSGVASRRLALETLIKIDREGAYANLALTAAFNRKQLSERDRAFVTALVQGVVRNQSEIDAIIASLSREPLSKMHYVLKNVLRIAVFQLSFMEDVPPSAVLDTSNRLARACGHEGMVRFANGVLRSYLRKKEEGSLSREEDSSESSEAENLSKKHSLPLWIADRWIKHFGLDEATELAAWSQSTPQLNVRVSEISIEPHALKRIFNEKGFPCREGKLVPSCLIFADEKGKKSFRGSPEKLPGYDEGLFAVQDEAAAFVSLVVAPKPGETVVDLCAAPGGKTVHLAELMQNTGKVIAVDRNASRLQLIKNARRRMGLTNIEIVEADGREYRPERPVDRVLVDAPCSGTGVLNRRSDIRRNRSAGDLESLAGVQKKLLMNAAEMLKPGGTLVYSTCSIEPEENQMVIDWLLKERSDLKPADLTPLFPRFLLDRWFPEKEDESKESGERGQGESTCVSRQSLVNGMVQFLPSRHDVSGFFVSRLVRGEETGG